jgi:predicted tellurium resistance membrane protein TerC
LYVEGRLIVLIIEGITEAKYIMKRLSCFSIKLVLSIDNAGINSAGAA